MLSFAKERLLRAERKYTLKKSEKNNKDTENKRKKHIDNSWLLVFYDLMICAAVDLLLLVIYKGSGRIDFADALVHSALSACCIFSMRAVWKVYRQVWRYGGIQSYIRLLMSDGIAFLLFWSIGRMLPVGQISFAKALCISCLSLLGSLSIRMVYRYAYKCCNKDTARGRMLNLLVKIFAGNRVELNRCEKTNKISVAIVGAGTVGVSLADELLGNPASAYVPKCFIDIDPLKIGRRIQDIPVISESSLANGAIDHYRIQEFVFALPQLTSDQKKELYKKYKAFGCKLKVYDYPVIHQAGSSKRHLREFDIEELLFRRPVVVTDEKTSTYYRDKVVLVTGGGGSIGSELCRQIAKMSPKQLIVLDVCENGAYNVQQELRMAYKDRLDLHVEILSVCNRNALERVFDNYRPDIVVHAAAHKHVPLMEHNCCEAIENNIFGTLNTVELSEKYHVRRFMMVSTDKAVNPTNVMGATKRMCEMIVRSYSAVSEYTTFSSTRFGNVLGSAGSVIPLFRSQIMNGGPVTLTDKRIVRYFMTIPEASQLVLQSGAMAENGELFVLDMGKPVKILDLAENMIRLSGYEPYRDIDIEEIGLRPGEKLYEELLVNTEKLGKTDNSLIFIEHDEPIGQIELYEKLAALRNAYMSGDDALAKQTLRESVPTFRSPEEVNAAAEKSSEMKIAVNA